MHCWMRAKPAAPAGGPSAVTANHWAMTGLMARLPPAKPAASVRLNTSDGIILTVLGSSCT